MVPSTSPLTTCDVAVEENMCEAWARPPTYVVTVYEVTGLPPLVGADQDTVTWLFPANALTPVGEAGAVAGDPGTVVGTPPAPPPTVPLLPEPPGAEPPAP